MNIYNTVSSLRTIYIVTDHNMYETTFSIVTRYIYL